MTFVQKTFMQKHGIDSKRSWVSSICLVFISMILVQHLVPNAISMLTLGILRSSDSFSNRRHGFLSLEPFRLLVNDERMTSIPMILETPCPDEKTWADEIALLYWMVGKETDDPELLAKERELQEMGKEDRKKQLDAVNRKAEKTRKKEPKKAAKPSRAKGRKGAKNVSESESSSSSENSEVEEDRD
jgi:AP endonuclease 1